MKLSNAVLLISALVSSTASATDAIRAVRGAKNIAKVLKNARRLEEGEGEGEEEEEAEDGEYDYLMQYTLKMISCNAGEAVVDEEGEYEYSAVVVRLCPSESGCDSDKTLGCKKGYGDYVVGLNTFVNAYFEDQRDNLNWDDGFEVDKYSECEEYEVEAAEDDAEDPYEGYQFFIGPTCGDGLDIKLALFSDETCTTESSVDFGDISNGWTLPYTSGGLVSTSCIDCVDYNDDGEYELRKLCEETYMDSPAKCESEMEYYSYYGLNEQGCDYISSLIPSSGTAGKIFIAFIFIALIAGACFYVMWWRKSKSKMEEPL